MSSGKQKLQPEQTQAHQPGIESEMTPAPDFMPRRPGTGQLKDKVAIISGGDSGIGRAVAVAYAREGAKVAICYLDENEDAHRTAGLVKKEGSDALIQSGDIGDEDFCKRFVKTVVDKWGRVDILVNNAAEQHAVEDFAEIEAAQIERTFRTNVFGYFFLTKAVLPHLREGSCIVNTTSVTAYKGNKELIDYASTRGAIVAFTRSLALALVDKKIRVNGVAPGPIWTPLIPASFDAEKVASHGSSAPMKRAGQPWEVATCHLFLATDDSSYMTGQILHPNGGSVVNG